MKASFAVRPLAGNPNWCHSSTRAYAVPLAMRYASADLGPMYVVPLALPVLRCTSRARGCNQPASRKRESDPIPLPPFLCQKRRREENIGTNFLCHFAHDFTAESPMKRFKAVDCRQVSVSTAYSLISITPTTRHTMKTSHYLVPVLAVVVLTHRPFDLMAQEPPILHQTGLAGRRTVESAKALEADLPAFEYVKKRDYHPRPFKCVVVMGESHVALRTWVDVLGALLTEFQGKPAPTMINTGIGANVISPRSPGYAASVKPSALERYRKDVIERNPDLVIISYGLNDMRAGMAPEDFRRDLSILVSDVRKAGNPVIVLTTVYNMSAYPLFPPFDKGSVEATEVYNLVIRQVAESFDALVADIWAAEGGAPWVMEFDTVHANRLGHTLIAHRVFQTVATNCSGAANSLKRDPAVDKAALAERHRRSVENARQEMKRTSKRSKVPQ